MRILCFILIQRFERETRSEASVAGREDYQTLTWVGSTMSMTRFSAGLRPWYFLFPVYLNDRKSMWSSAFLPGDLLHDLPVEGEEGVGIVRPRRPRWRPVESLEMFFSFTLPSAVLTSIFFPSVSTQTGVTCGEPSGLIVAMNAKFLPLRRSMAFLSSFTISRSRDRDPVINLFVGRGGPRSLISERAERGSSWSDRSRSRWARPMSRYEWSDGHASVFANQESERGCPCALCQGEINPAQRGRGRSRWCPTFAPGVRATEYRMVGLYAVAFAWSDGHTTGSIPTTTCSGPVRVRRLRWRRGVRA